MIAAIPGTTPEQHPLRPIIDGWTGRLQRCRDHKEPWQDVADECEMFYSAACGWLWEPEFRKRFWGGRDVDPTFRITLARPFEFVALMGPSLYWNNPRRQAVPNEFVQIPPELFGDVEKDPQAQAAYQQEVQAFQAETTQRNMAARLQEMVLNKTPDLLGLHEESRLAVVDMLLTGRAILETVPYRHPGSRKLLVKSERLNPAFHYVDPDCERADQAWYHIVERHEPYWEVERKFRLHPAGVLKNAATAESASKQGAMWGENLTTAASSRATGDSRDMVTYYEVYSRMGTGLRDHQAEYVNPMARALEQVAGDYCYLAFCPGVNYLLNCPDWVLYDRDQGTVEAVRQRLAWPIPYWTEAKYPFSMADAYPRKRPGGRGGYPYPLSPLASGIGELKAINILMCSLLYGTWMSSRTIAAVLQSAEDTVSNALKSAADWAVIPLEDISDDLKKVIQFVEFNPQSADRYKVIAMLGEVLDRRWGLNDLIYGQSSGTQDRSATATQAKQASTAIRPQDLGMRVADWQREVARREAYGLWHTLQPGDLTDILGRSGAAMWGKYVKSQPGERIIRQIDYQIEATPMKRPDLQRDGENLRNFMQSFGALEQWYIQTTGDVEPFNALKQLFGKTTGMKMDALMFKPPQKPDPSQDPELQIKQAELQLDQMKAQLQAKIDEMKAQQQLLTDREKSQQDLFQDQQSHGQEMGQDEQKHRQEMIQMAEQAAVKLDVARAGLEQKREEGRLKIILDRKQAAAKPTAAAGNGRN